MTIVEYFNPQSPSHLRQYLKYEATGSFDKDFPPPEIKMCDLFFEEIRTKIIKHHIKMSLAPVIKECSVTKSRDTTDPVWGC